MATEDAQIVEMLRQAYMMELETVDNYLANSIHLDGVEADQIKDALAADVTEELEHARRLARRIKQLGGRVPGSMELDRSQHSLQPPEDRTDVRTVVDGVLDAERTGIAHYRKIIAATDGLDFVTQDLAINILSEEEEHRTQFEGYQAGFRAEPTMA